MKRKFFSFSVAFCIGVLVLSGQNSFLYAVPQSHVVFQKKATHYEVVVDLTDGVRRFDVGKEYWSAARKAVPSLEFLVDSYLDETVVSLAGHMGWSREETVLEIGRRIALIRPRIPAVITQEIEGLAFESANVPDVLGDGRLSRNEFYFWNLYADVVRPAACSAFAAFGHLSTTEKTLAARNLDWVDGSQGQLSRLHCVMTIKNGPKSVFLIGFVGFLGVVSGINDDGVLAAILDSETGAQYAAEKRRSYTLDLRYALENFPSQTQIAAYMAHPARKYAFNHLIFLADGTDARVLENNFSGTGTSMRRAVRISSSPLNPGIQWGIRDAIGAVNSFLLRGNHDNHTGNSGNTLRWNTMVHEAGARSSGIDLKGIKHIITYQDNPGAVAPSAGDLFGAFTLQSMIIELEDLALWIAFKPASGGWKRVPKFERVRIVFE